MEVLHQKRSRWGSKGKKNFTAWKSYLKRGARGRGRGRRSLGHGSPSSKEQVSKEEDELRHGSPTSKEKQVREEEDEEP